MRFETSTERASEGPEFVAIACDTGNRMASLDERAGYRRADTRRGTRDDRKHSFTLFFEVRRIP